MSSQKSLPSRLALLLGRLTAVLFFPVTLPIAIATNYRGFADRLSVLPGIRAGGGMIGGVAILVYLVAVLGIVGGVAAVAVGAEGQNIDPGGNPGAAKAPRSTETATPNTSPSGRAGSATETPPVESPETATRSPSSTPIQSETPVESTSQRRYQRLLSNVEQVYPKTARNSYPEPYLTFRGGSYDIKSKSVTLNFSMDSLDSIDRYEKAVARTSEVYIWSHFRSETAYPETVRLNYFRDGQLNATAKIRSRWMRQYVFGNVSSGSYAPLSHQTYVSSVLGTLKVEGEKIEFQSLIERCEKESPTNPGKCKNSLRDRMPVRFYLPERTATGTLYTNVMGEAQPTKYTKSRGKRVGFLAEKLKQNITGTASLEGYTPALESKVWEDVDMKIRDVYRQNETIVIEQYTRSSVGDDSLPLRQRDVIAAKYGRLAVEYGARYMPVNGVLIIQYTPNGQKYAKVRVPNYTAVGYINGERGINGLGLGVEIIEQYQEPGS